MANWVTASFMKQVYTHSGSLVLRLVSNNGIRRPTHNMKSKEWNSPKLPILLTDRPSLAINKDFPRY